MHKLTAINVHWALKIAANIIFTFLPPSVGGKISLLSNDGGDVFSTYNNMDNFEEKYGGNHPNLESDFWPPRLNL